MVRGPATPIRTSSHLLSFPVPNQIAKRPKLPNTHPDLRPVPKGIGKTTLAGTQAAARTVIRYRNGVLNGKGASLLDGYMEDLATDRIYRLMIAQRVRHTEEEGRLKPGGTIVEATAGNKVKVPGDDAKPVEHTPELVTRVFDEELAKIQRDLPTEIDQNAAGPLPEARRIAEEMIVRGHHSPI